MKKLFLSGTARGGTNLAIMMLSANDKVNLCQDPLLPFLKYFKAVVSNLDILETISNPLDEYYYYEKKIELMNKLQESNLNIDFDQKYIKELNVLLKNRMSLSSPKFVNEIENINEKNFASYVENFLSILSKDNNDWNGFNDNWAIEFFKPLSNTFKNSKFISIVRDGRDALASHIKLVDAKHINPLYKYQKSKAMIAMSLSFIRCWRKQIAFTYHYKKILKSNFHIIKYEDLVVDPKKEMKSACSFLDIKYDDNMINPDMLISGDGNKWLSNSNHSNQYNSGIYSSSIGKWKSTLPEPLIEMFNYCANLELIIAGYENNFLFREDYYPINAFKKHDEEVKEWTGGSFGWRTDNNNPKLDFEFEFSRNKMCQLVEKNDHIDYDNNLLKKFFLFEDIYNDLVNNQLSTF